tara:strand:- start:373 stop:987 length:615 start_codon:yes stop_codon:yes gene_type:complete
MEHVCLDLEGVLIPEIWAEVAEYTGEEQFKLTTQDLKDYSELMDMRINLVQSIGLSFSEIQSLVKKMEPYEGARDFIDWVRDNFQLTIVSDSFYELAWPLLRKLGTPAINCHYLEIKDNNLIGYKLRQLENKKKVVQSLKDMKFKVFASGDSYNDIQMLQEADLGVFYQAPKHIREEFKEINGVESHADLKNLFIENSSFIGRT